MVYLSDISVYFSSLAPSESHPTLVTEPSNELASLSHNASRLNMLEMV